VGSHQPPKHVGPLCQGAEAREKPITMFESNSKSIDVNPGAQYVFTMQTKITKELPLFFI
jgi:hypothetical protein